MTRKLPNKFEIIRRAKAGKVELLGAIQLKCGDCMGFFLDPYEGCTDKQCPLYNYYPTKGRASSPSYKIDLARLAKARDNPSYIISEIKKLEPKLGLNDGLKTAKRSKGM